MALTITSTAKDPSANSYISLSDANYFFSTKFKESAPWLALTNDQRVQLLIEATRILETYIYGGTRTTTTQALSWPRSNLVSREGTIVNSQTIPKQLEAAQCEMAAWLLTEDDRMLSDIDLQQVDQFKAGPLDIKVKASAVTVPPMVKALISSISPEALVTVDNTSVKQVSICR